MANSTSSQPDRNLALDIVRVTEAAAMAASRWMGRGDKEGADGAAVDAMRITLQSVPMDGIVVIGEGEKDEAPMLFNGESVGDGDGPATDIAVDPIDGTTLTAKGRGNALAVIAVSERGTMFDPGPCVYMEKIAVGPECVGVVDLNATVTENLQAVAKAKGESVRNVTAVILDRDRHDDLIAEVREAGARIRLIPDGDVAGAISTAWDDSGADILFGIGGTPEGVITAAALKCMGGEILGRLWPRNDEERDAALAGGYDLERVLDHRRPGRRRQLLLRRHRHHRRRAAQGRPLRPPGRHHPVARDALTLGHRPHDQRPAQPVEARRLQRHRVRLTRASLALAPARMRRRVQSDDASQDQIESRRCGREGETESWTMAATSRDQHRAPGRTGSSGGAPRRSRAGRRGPRAAAGRPGRCRAAGGPADPTTARRAATTRSASSEAWPLARSGDDRSHSGRASASRSAPWNIHRITGAGTSSASTITSSAAVDRSGTPWASTTAATITIEASDATISTRTAPTR